MNYTCDRCGYEFIQKNDYVRHLNKKKTCPAVKSNVSTSDLLKMLSNTNLSCEYCGKTFTYYQNCQRHQKTCKSKPQNDITSKVKLLEEQCNLLKQQIDILTKERNSSYNNNINSNNNIQQNNNINLNIKLKEFNLENMDALPVELVSSYFLNLEFRNLIESLHFDPEFPENHNVKLRSIKRNAMEIFMNDKWNIVTLVNGLNELIMQGHRIFTRYYIKNKDKILEEDMSEEQLIELLDKLNNIENFNKKEIAPLQHDLQLLLETYRSNIKDKLLAAI